MRAVSDDAGSLEAAYAYDPWGRRTTLLGNPDEVDFGYTGHFTHHPTGLALAPYRAYDPDLGRWISRDPIGEEGGLNVYAYVANNPIKHVDPLGLIYRCIQPLHAWPEGFNGGVGTFHHAFVCDDQGQNCYGQDWENSSWWHTPLFAPGKPSVGDAFDKTNCTRLEPNNDCVNTCIISRSKNPDRPFYSLPYGWTLAPVFPNCQEYADQEIMICIQQCSKP